MLDCQHGTVHPSVHPLAQIDLQLSMTRTTNNKPDKPYSKFPMLAHASGQWAAKLNGKLHYFGTWDDWQGALDRYTDQRDFLRAGKTPPAKPQLLRMCSTTS
jgi:hypothetical protein